MKRILILALFATRLSAQWIVHDPINTAVATTIQTGQAANQVEILRQWAASLEKLNAQLEQLRAQLAEQRRIREVIGDPAAAGERMSMDALGASDFERSFGETTAALRRIARAVDSLKNTAGGIFDQLTDFTVLNQPFARQTAPYQRFAVVDAHAANLEEMFGQTEPRLNALRQDLAATVQQLKAAATQADVEKLQAKIAVLNGQLAAIGASRQEAAMGLLAQQTLNNSQAAKEQQDFLEKQIAEEQQSFAAIGAWQQSIRLTPTSYTQP